MKRISNCLILIVLGLLIAAGPVLASGAPVLDRIVESGELRVGMTGDQPPLNVKSKAGNLIGLEVDLARVLASSMEVEAKFVVKPFAELLDALTSGEVDMVMSGMTITPKRNLKVAFVGPYIVSGKSILTKSKTLAMADETGDINLETVRLAALEGSTSQRFVENMLPKAKLTKSKDNTSAVRMVLDEQVDALVADVETCLIAVLRYPEADLATLAVPLTLEPIGIAVPPNDPLFLNLIQNYIDMLDGAGLLEELTKKWYEDGSWLIQVP